MAETIEAGGYVYLRLEDGTWIAANTFAVSRGDEVQYNGGMEMTSFHSKSLDRTFDSILFVSEASLVNNNGDDKPAVAVEGHGSKDMQLKKPASATAPAPGEITALQDGKTVAAIFAESAGLKGQMVSLNARVIKVNEQIMGKNWITLQDGTGADPDNKLLATSQEMVAPGALVVAKGTVVTDVDLGYGYNYKVLLEEVTFSPGVE
ncbi:MAG: hypothetical protein MUP31_04865 [Xanthomonadales bacterium]|nr:hypothetical protein [Xanthomonadales bacterium]